MNLTLEQAQQLSNAINANHVVALYDLADYLADCIRCEDTQIELHVHDDEVEELRALTSSLHDLRFIATAFNLVELKEMALAWGITLKHTDIASMGR